MNDTQVSIQALSVWTLWRQSKALLVANLKSRYRKTIAGFLWVVLNPLIMYGTQSYVFKYILKIQVLRYNIFLLSGLIPWIFATSSFTMCVTCYVAAGRLLKSYPVHPGVYLLAQILDNLVNFFASFLVIGIPVLLFGKVPLLAFLYSIPPVVSLLVGVLSISWILALTQVFFRDTAFILNFGISVLFFLTPIIYPIELVPEQLRWAVQANPLNLLIAPFHAAIYDFDFQKVMTSTALSAGVSVFIFILAYALWRKTRNLVYFHL